MASRRFNSYLQKARKKSGDAGEEHVRLWLQTQGYKRINRIHTPYKLIYSPADATGRRHIVSAFPVEKVQGDFVAIAPDGRYALVEVKSRKENRLPWSALESHQREALTDHHNSKGLSLLIWEHNGEIRCYQWPIAGFKERESLIWEQG